MPTISPLAIYAILKLDDICAFFMVICFISSVVLTIIFMISKIDEDDSYKNIIKISAISTFISLILATTVPNTNQFIAIIGLPKVINSEFAQKLPNEAQKLIDNYIKNTTGDKK